MVFVYWRKIFAVAGYLTILTFCLPALAQSKNDTPQPGPHIKQSGKITEPDKTLPILEAIQNAINRVANTIEAQQDNTDPQRKNQLEEDNLHVQRQMADWTKYAVWVALFATLLTFAGVGMIWRTLHYTRIAASHTETASIAAIDAVEEAKRGTAAALEANNIQQRIFIADQRAWLIIDSVTFTSDLKWDWNKREGRVTVKVGYTNKGKTPAKGVWVDMNLVSHLSDQDSEVEYAKTAASARNAGRNFGHIVFPGESHTSAYEMAITEEQIQDSYKKAGLKEEKDFLKDAIAVFLSVICVIDYGISVADERHQTGFKFPIQAKPNANGDVALGPYWGDTARTRLYVQRSLRGDIRAD